MCVFQRHTARRKTGVGREGGREEEEEEEGGDSEITWFTNIYSLQKEKGRAKESRFSASGKASLVHFSLAFQQ